MKKLVINELEVIEGGARKGVECGIALLGLAAAGIGLATITVAAGRLLQ